MSIAERPILSIAAPTSGSPLPRWTEIAVESLLFLALAFAPFAFGAIEAWSQLILLGLVFGALLVLSLGHLLAGERFVWTWAYVPIAALLSVGCLQLLPLSSGVLKLLSPQSAAIREPLLALAGQPTGGAETISLYPLATERQLRLLLGGAAMFAVVAQFYGVDRRDRGRRLLLWIASVGLGVAMLALWQNFSASRTIYGVVSQSHPYSGPFANHSHFGQFLNLSLGAAFALLAIRLRELQRRGLTRAGIADELQRRANWDVTLLLVFVTVGPVALFLSLTRGGTLSFLIAAAIVPLIAVLVRRRGADVAGVGSDGTIAGGFVVGLAIFAVLLAVGFNVVYDRLATLRHVDHSSGGRFEILRDALALWRTFPIVGSGLGTHAFVFPMFDRSAVAGWATYAENEYVQLLEETGIVGIACLLTFAAIVVASFARAIRSGRRTRAGIDAWIVRGALPGLAFGLIAVTIHSWTDFGQHVPAVSFLTAATCGLIVAFAREPSVTSSRRRGSRRAAIVGRVAIVGIVVVVAGWSLTGAARDRDADLAWTRAIADRDALDARGWAIDSPTYRDLLASGADAVARQPRDVEYAFWLNTWRWEAIAQQADATGALDDQLAGWTRTLIDALRATTRQCPTFGRPLAFAGELELKLDPTSAVARRSIERGTQLASYDAQASLNAGRLAASDGRADAASSLIRRAVTLGMPVEAAIDVFVGVLNDPAAAVAMAGDDPSDLRYLNDLLAKRPDDAAIAAKVRSAYDRAVRAQAEDVSASPAALDRFADQMMRDSHDVPQAIAVLTRAVSMDYGNVDRRLRLAGLLVEAGRADEAVAQARLCLRLRPGLQAAEAIVGRAGAPPRAPG